MDQTRLFWAVNLPVNVKVKLVEWQSHLRSVQADVKWVEQQNLHLTLKFLGDVDNTSISGIVRTVEQAVACSGAFTLELGRFGFFPGPHRPKVVWVGVRGEVDRFRRLHQKVGEDLSKIGFPPENRRFSPHLTMGRIRSPRDTGELMGIVEMLNRESPETLARVEVAAIDLMKSQLTRKGPKYSLVDTVKLMRPANS